MIKRVSRFIEHVIIATERRFRRSSASFAMLILLAIGIYFVVGFAKEVVHGQQLSAEVSAELQRNADLEQSNARLKEEQQYYQSDGYVELAAREGLNLRKPDQIIGLVVGPTPGPNDRSSIHPAAPTAKSDAPPQANWQRWFGLFFK
jgi:cell division protein FtsB